MRGQRKKILPFLLLVGALWLSAAFIHYRLAHPELTETQLFLHFFDALRFR
jgi:hypothetical protein